MLSRVANSIYWVNRYVERAENYARFISVNINLALDAPGLLTEQWEPLLIATNDRARFTEFYEIPTRENVVFFMTFDARNPNSIYSCLSEARENARTIREVITKEMWEHLNSFYLSVKENSRASNRSIEELRLFFEEIKFGCQSFWGIIDATQTRNEGFHFGRLGKLLERADKTSRFLDVQYFSLLPNEQGLGTPKELLIWTSVLKSASAFNMYRQQHHGMVPSKIVEFLILDRSFPRSIAFSIKQAELSLYEISGQKYADGYSNPAEKQLSSLRHEIEFSEINDIFEMGLHDYLDVFQTKNNRVGASIQNTYFGLKPVEIIVQPQPEQ